MKKLLICVFLIGLFTTVWSTPPPDFTTQSANTKFEKSGSQLQADVIYAADVTTAQTSETQVPVKWVDENLLSAASGILLVVYEFLALKMPTSKSISILGNLYKLMTWFIPDKSKSGGKFTIREKN